MRGFVVPASFSVFLLFAVLVIARVTTDAAFLRPQTVGYSRITTTTQRRRSSSCQALYATTDKCDVAVFGGGFGGLYTALALARQQSRGGRKKKQLDIVLVEPSESFVFLPLLYDLTVGTATEAEVCPNYNDLLKDTGIRRISASLVDLEQLPLFDDKVEGYNTMKKDQQGYSSARLKPNNSQGAETLQFQAGVMAVGATPTDILQRVPGALELAQPFYTAKDAKRTRRLLNSPRNKLEKIAVVGGGYGGVELAASVARRLSSPGTTVHLLSRGPPMAGTRAEPWIDEALSKLGVVTEDCTVDALEKKKAEEESSSSSSSSSERIIVKRTLQNSNETVMDEWDAVLWTAGSRPASAVLDGCESLLHTGSGRLHVDPTLRCCQKNTAATAQQQTTPVNLWALGDCAEVVDDCDAQQQPALPKTAQVAMQQAETVAKNVRLHLDGERDSVNFETFTYQDLGSMLTLGGPNGAVLAPKDGAFAPIFAPLLDSVDGALKVADNVLESTVGKSELAKDLGLTPEILGMSLGSHGLVGGGVTKPGTMAGTLTGAARRAVYAVRMPTNEQRAVSFVSAALSTAVALAKEASEKRNF